MLQRLGSDSRPIIVIATCLLMTAPAIAAADPSAAPYAEDARALAPLIRDNYAYMDALPGGVLPNSPQLEAERDEVHDKDSLLHYAEDMMAALADHHALTGKSFKEDWAVVPSYADLWIVKVGDAYVIDAVKSGSAAENAGIKTGDRLVGVDGEPIDVAISAFWSRLGLEPIGERASYAARVIAAGRRNRPRILSVVGANGQRIVTLDSLYKSELKRPVLTVSQRGHLTAIRFNNSIGDRATIAVFDAAMIKIPTTAPVLLDLTDTPSGGESTIARAIMSWFVRMPAAYQTHQLPAEERETGIVRQWVEYVMPRPGKFHSGPVSVRVGRWTGSMGEGIAIGLQSMHKSICGTPMAGLKGAVYDFDLPHTGLRVKFPAERLYTVDGKPRHQVAVRPCRS